jgi:Leucine-rich repeat (LRR) protein
LRDYTLSDLKNLHTLNIIANFGLQNPNFKVKDSHPQLTDISWISNLKNLQNVSFRGCNQLVNVGPIKDLPNLKELDLRDTGVKNTGFLASSTLKITV